VIAREENAVMQLGGELSPPEAFVTWRAITHQGLVRDNNEDALCVETRNRDEQESYLMAVADGLGGHLGGAVASQLALKIMQDEFYSWSGRMNESFITRAIRRANLAVYNTAHSKSELFNMQTTLTAVTLESDLLTVGHIGDCRLFRVRNGRIELLTRDHTLASDLLQLHLITPEQAGQHPGRHQLTRSLGAELLLRIDLFHQQIMPGDTYLLCSDGLWSEIALEDIKNTIQQGNINKACEELTESVLSAGAPDNLSGIAFRVMNVRKQPAAFSWRTLLRGT
jgi:protein phosphatase